MITRRNENDRNEGPATKSGLRNPPIKNTFIGLFACIIIIYQCDRRDRLGLCEGPATNSGHRNAPMYIPDFEKINFSDQICPTLGHFQHTRNVRIRIRACSEIMIPSEKLANTNTSVHCTLFPTDGCFVSLAS